MVVLPQKTALALLPELVDDSTVDSGFAKVQALIARGEAQLEANLVVKGEAGKKSMVEGTDEIRYPTEWDPPHLPNQVPKENAVEVLKHWPLVGFTPTAFETRNVGPSLEIEPVTPPADGRSLELTVSAGHTRFVRWLRYDAGALPSGEQLALEQPQFQSMKNTSTLRLQNGQRMLLGVHKVPDDSGAMELFLLRVSLSKVP